MGPTYPPSSPDDAANRAGFSLWSRRRAGKVADGTLTRNDLAVSARAPRAIAGTLVGDTPYLTGWTQLGSVTLPPGRWLLSGQASVSGDFYRDCRLYGSGRQIAIGEVWNGTAESAVIPVSGLLTVTQATPVKLECYGGGSPDYAMYPSLWAVEVAP